MALSTRARIAGIGGALALGVLGAGGYAYAESTGGGTGASYVTVVDDGSTGQAPSGQAPAQPDRGTGDRADCPEKGGGTGSGGTGSSPAPAPSTPAAPGSTDGAADA